MTADGAVARRWEFDGGFVWRTGDELFNDGAVLTAEHNALAGAYIALEAEVKELERQRDGERAERFRIRELGLEAERQLSAALAQAADLRRALEAAIQYMPVGVGERLQAEAALSAPSGEVK